MKIIYVITKANFGGAQKYVLDLSAAARDAGHDVAVCYGEPGLLAEKLREAGIRSVAVSELGRDVRVGSDLRAVAALRAQFMRERPDVVHLNSSKAGVVGALAARLSGVPRIIFTAHGWAFNEQRPWRQKIPIALLHYLCVLLAHRTICVSEAVRRDAAWMPFARRKLALVHNGVAEPQFITREKARMFLHKGAAAADLVWVGTIAELHPNKRLDIVIEAFARISKKFPNAMLAIMGEGEERKRLEALIRKKDISARTILCGHVQDAARYLTALDVFVLPSHTEAMSLSILEAGFAALPVVASNVGGIPEIIDNGVSGILCERGNTDAFAAALEKLLASSGEREHLGTALREKVTREFSLEQMILKTLALYE